MSELLKPRKNYSANTDNNSQNDNYALFNDIMQHKSAHCGFWHGNPHPESYKKLFDYFGVKTILNSV
ncbi:MAG: hypothetical protein FWD71_00325 [Oscillospiraceae bacterium]|nr:hypothetical protein [Oscillospiraceae bacterium]